MGHEIEVMALLRFRLLFPTLVGQVGLPNVAPVLPPDLVHVLDSSRQPPWDQVSLGRTVAAAVAHIGQGTAGDGNYRSWTLGAFSCSAHETLGSRVSELIVRLEVHCSRKNLRDASALVVDLTVGPS